MLKTLEEFKSIHLNYLVLANNHLKDYGEQGLAYTLHQLDQASISYIGAGLNQKMLTITLKSLLRLSTMRFLMVIGIETRPIWIMTFMR